MTTIAAYITDLEKARDAFRVTNRPLFIAVSDTLAKMSTRIFISGQNVAGSTAKYGGGEIYINPEKNRVSASQVRGKPGKERNVKNRKTVYFPSYKAYREKVGLISSHVVYENMGDLRSDFENTKIGGKPKPDKVSANHFRVVISRSNNVDKSRWLDTKYNLVFGITASEKKNFLRVIEFEFGRHV